MPEGRIPWKESNLALIGSDLDHKIKAAAAAGEPQWQGLGQEPGTHVWRIEQFRVVPWPTKQYGQFHQGDSYVVLNSYKKKPDSDALAHDIHIWIGTDSSQDEYGTAAYKMVEADEFLGGAAVQHRQVQGRESPMFQSYFEGGNLQYLEGGTASGFTHVEPTPDKPNLYRVKGTEKGLSLTQCSLKKSSLNEGDSFILVANKSLVWVWHGKSANPDEKARANSMGEKMCTEGTVVVMEHGHGDENHPEFWKYLENDGDIAPADEMDDEVEQFAPLLFRLSPSSEPEQVAKGEVVKTRFGKPQTKISRGLLDESDIFLLDAGWELFLWIGKKADRNEKLAAMAQADAYAKEDPRTADLPLTMVKSGYENHEFEQFFS